jgi:hypothetical protein
VADRRRQPPENYCRVETDQGARILAYGRDPNFPGWPDTLQLNYANPALQTAKMAELVAIAEQCDGLRYDMAMLVLPEVFQRTWGLAPARRGSTVRIGWRASSRITTSLARRRAFPRRDIRRPPSSRISRRGCQLEDARVRVPVHLRRGPVEPGNPDIAVFYARLLAVLGESDAFRDGAWSLIPPQPAWAGNPTWQDFISYAWRTRDGGSRVVVINYSDHQAQCHLQLPFTGLAGVQFRLVDVMASEVYCRDGARLINLGLYIDLEAWRYNVFKLEPVGS